jgi:hypothetical protein
MHTAFFIRKKHQGLTSLKQRSIRRHHLSDTCHTYKTDEVGDLEQGPFPWSRTNAHHQKAGGLAKSPNYKPGTPTGPADPRRAPTHALSKVAASIFLRLVFKTVIHASTLPGLPSTPPRRQSPDNATSQHVHRHTPAAETPLGHAAET